MSRTPPPRTAPAIRSAKAAPAPRTAYLVLGMHRSGTSAVTQLLALAGASLPAHVMPGDAHNEKGYFEPWKIAIFNDERLRAGGSAWDDIFAFPYRPLREALEQDWQTRAGKLFDKEFRGKAWPLLKDPRATVLLPLWRAVLAERGIGVRCVIPVRHPLAVAASLGRRDGFAVEKSVLVWSAYMLAAEAYTRDLPRAFTAYDALLSDWRSEAARIETAHGAPLPRLTAAAGQKIDQFLSPDLRHNAETGDLKALGWAGEIAQQVLDGFEAKAAGGEPDRAALDRAAAALEARNREIGVLVSPATRDLASARADLIDARQTLAGAAAAQAELRAEIAAQIAARRADIAQMEAGWKADLATNQAEVRRLEAGWRADQVKLQCTLALLSMADAELDAALAED